jgi:hypothetical protein
MVPLRVRCVSFALRATLKDGVSRDALYWVYQCCIVASNGGDSTPGISVTRLNGALFSAGIFILAFHALPISVSTRRDATSCGQGKTLAASSELRLYSVASSASGEVTVYVCSKRSGRYRHVGPVRRSKVTWSSSMPGPFSLAAPWGGGIEDRLVGQDTVRVYTAVRNVQTGESGHCRLGGADRPGQLPRVRGIFLDKSGSLAWVVIMRQGVQGPQIGVCESGVPRIVDTGYGIDTASVSLHGSTLTWLDSGTRQSATLR